MGLSKAITLVFRRFLPSPFTIAVVLTLVTVLLALLFTENPGDSYHLFTIVSFWEAGIWNNALLVFAYQMMLILVLGHVLVLSKPFEYLILRVTKLVTNTANAATLVVVSTMLVAFFNWGLALIFGAILARKVGEHAQRNNIGLNYPLIGACGYAGLMVWHGGMSGSAPLKVAEPQHLKNLLENQAGVDVINQLPALISTSDTVFSVPNLLIFLVVLVVIGTTAFFVGKRTAPTKVELDTYQFKVSNKGAVSGAEKLDHSKKLSFFFGLLVLFTFFVRYLPALKVLNITPNMLNFFMFGLAILLHGSFKSFLNAVEEAIVDVSGILIQFPMYFGIMGIMSSSGMITHISNFFVSISTTATLPLFTFFSAGLVNIFVPSGGGQWAVQGPLVLQSALSLNVPLNKAVLALAYGDQITNMIQPFWALPLLGITRLKAKEILPYTLLFMVIGAAVYLLGLLAF